MNGAASGFLGVAGIFWRDCFAWATDEAKDGEKYWREFYFSGYLVHSATERNLRLEAPLGAGILFFRVLREIPESVPRSSLGAGIVFFMVLREIRIKHKNGNP